MAQQTRSPQRDSATRVLHVITGLPHGGSEMMLYKLLSRADRNRFESSVVCLLPEGPMAKSIRGLGVSVESVGMRSAWSAPGALRRLRRRISTLRPHVIQTWLYHADLLGGVTARLTGRPPVVWGIRNSKLDPRALRPSTILIARLCARLSRRLPAKIVCCSEAGRQAHLELGYDAEKMIVIPNGFDLERFQPDPNARLSVRRELGVGESTPVVGLVARFDPHKDHANFIAAAGRIASRHPDAHFVQVGTGIEWSNRAIAQAIEQSDLRRCFHLLGARDDVARLTASFDVAVSASLSEGFSNVIGEAMASAIPCVATAVGDSSWIVGETGRVVPPRDPAALAEALADLLSLPSATRQDLGARARQRVLEHFNLSDIVSRYQALYEELATDARKDRRL